MRELIGYFKVSHPDGTELLVIVSQDITTDKRGVVVAARKIFTLNTVDGEEVSRPDNKRFFSRENGQLLKIIGNCITNESDLLRLQMNKRRQAR
ncbi:hypothetical protein [Desulfosediminicola sp.]|uniref:hypothetical protein n=1 Tax=Desulfosediminicola sp. TaxID=2886825 RepID=UPI003AF1F515